MAINKEITIDVRGNAAQSLTDISRIAQDVPFGFVAIQNNIGPLVESFGRLTTNAGGLAGGIRALGAALTGPAGIGLAISLITSAVTFLTQTFNPWSKIFGTAADDTKKAKEELKKFNEEMNKTIATADTTGTKLKTYIAVAQDFTKSEKERVIAIKEANKIMGEYGEKITLANVGTKAITDQINSYVAALKQQAITQTFVSRLTQQYTKEQEANVKILEVEEKISSRKVQRDKDIAASNGIQRSIAVITAKAESDINSLRVDRNKLVGEYNKLSREGDAIEKDYSKTVEKTLGLQAKAGGLNEDKNKKSKSTKEKFDLAGFLTDDEFNVASKTAETQYERLRSNEDKRYNNQLTKLDDALTKKEITQEEFNSASIQLEKNHTQIVASLKENEFKIKEQQELDFQKKINQLKLETTLIGETNIIEIARIKRNEYYKQLLDDAKQKYGEFSQKYKDYQKAVADKQAAEEKNEREQTANKLFVAKEKEGKRLSDLTIKNNTETFNNEKLTNKEKQEEIKTNLRNTLANINLTSEQRLNVEKDATQKIKSLVEQEKQTKLDAYKVIGEAMGALSNIVGKETAAGKALAIAQATINTYLAITEIWKAKASKDTTTELAIKIAGSITAAASGFAAVKGIISTKVPGGGGGGAVPTLSPTLTGAINTSPQTQLASTIAGAQREPIKAYVVSSQMTTQQALDRNIKSNATFG